MHSIGLLSIARNEVGGVGKESRGDSSPRVGAKRPIPGTGTFPLDRSEA